MAQVCKLKCGTTELNLLSGVDGGWRISPDWFPRSATPIYRADPEPVVESMDLICDATSHDNLASQFQGLDEMRVLADAYVRDALREDPVWLHVKMSDETGEKRALVRHIDLQWGSAAISEMHGPPDNVARVRLTLEREPWWERTAALSPGYSGMLSGAAVIFDYTTGGSSHDIAGDVGARWQPLVVYSSGTGVAVGRVWMGLRSQSKHPNLASFQNIWELEDPEATLGTDATRATDATASPGGAGNTKVTVTPGTEGWAKRLSVTLADIAGDRSSQYGDYLWLLRHKLSEGSSTWEAQLRFGYSNMDDDDFIRGPIVELDQNVWDYAEMGRMLIPLRSLKAFPTGVYGEGGDRTYGIQVWARRTSGTANLDLDCLCPIPLDEGWLKSWDFSLPAADTGNWYFAEGPAGRTQVFAECTYISHICSYALFDFRLPIGDGRIYVVYAPPSGTGHDITKGIALSAATEFYERWANLRGAE